MNWDESRRIHDRSIVFRQPTGTLECLWLHRVDGAWQWGGREGAEVFANYLEADRVASQMKIATGDFCFAFVLGNTGTARDLAAADAAAQTLHSARKITPQAAFEDLERRHLA